MFNKIPIFKFNFNNVNTTLREGIDKIEKLTNVKNRKKIFKTLDNLKIEVKNLNLKVLIGAEDAAFTAILVGVISSLFSMYTRKYLKQNTKNYWEINPIFNNEDILKLNLNCIISLKLIHIIYAVFKSKKKEEDENGGKSNTEYYVYSHEKYKRNG